VFYPGGTVQAKQRVESAVLVNQIRGVDTEVALMVVLPILKTILSQMPWYKKIILTVKFLIGGIEGYLKDKGWDV
jgi:hypothetical protein